MDRRAGRDASRCTAVTGSCCCSRPAPWPGSWSRSRSRSTAGRRCRVICSRRSRRLCAGRGAVGRVILELPPILRGSPRASRRARSAGQPGPRARVRWHLGARRAFAAADRAGRPQARASTRARDQPALDGRQPARRVARILACGQPNMPIGYQSVLAWYTGMEVGILYISPTHVREPDPSHRHLLSAARRVERDPESRRRPRSAPDARASG